MPTYVTHYHPASRRPFLNLSELDGPQLDDVLQELADERARGDSARVFGRRYMELRRRTEEALRTGFMARGGRPERSSPHYFVLGSSPWYRGLARDMQEVTMPVAALPPEASTFTIPDSFTAMGLGADYGLHHQPRPYHRQVFGIAQLTEVVDRFGLPEGGEPGYDNYQGRPFERYVEIQLWSDAPVRRWLE